MSDHPESLVSARRQRRVCRIPMGAISDHPCPSCGHRVGSHAIVEGGGTCDICWLADALRLGDERPPEIVFEPEYLERD